MVRLGAARIFVGLTVALALTFGPTAAQVVRADDGDGDCCWQPPEPPTPPEQPSCDICADLVRATYDFFFDRPPGAVDDGSMPYQPSNGGAGCGGRGGCDD